MHKRNNMQAKQNCPSSVMEGMYNKYEEAMSNQMHFQ